METTIETVDSVHTSEKEAIVLWNPTAAALWSLLFTPAFGAWLHMRNWERLGQPGKARQSRYWFAGLLMIALASYAAGVAGAVLGREDLSAPWWLSLVLFVAWGAQSAYPQIRHVDDHHGESYARRSWALPIVLGLAAICALPILAAVAVGYLDAAGY